MAQLLAHLVVDVIQHRHLEKIPGGYVDLARDEGERAGRDILDDLVLDAVEIRPVLFPVVRVARYLDGFVGLELDELEGPRPDRVLPHLGRRHVARIDWGEAGGEQRDERWLRPLQLERHLVIAVQHDPVEVAVPRPSRIEPQLLGPLPLQQVPSALDVPRREWLSVAPFDILPQLESELFSVLAPRPLAR